MGQAQNQRRISVAMRGQQRQQQAGRQAVQQRKHAKSGAATEHAVPTPLPPQGSGSTSSSSGSRSTTAPCVAGRQRHGSGHNTTRRAASSSSAPWAAARGTPLPPRHPPAAPPAHCLHDWGRVGGMQLIGKQISKPAAAAVAAAAAQQLHSKPAEPHTLGSYVQASIAGIDNQQPHNVPTAAARTRPH